jgi:Na+/phosphate symporter
MNYKWLTFNCVTLFIVAFLIQFYDGFNQLLALDHTYVSLFIVAQYVAISTYLGIKKEASNFNAVRYYANMLPLIGMVGTLTAVMLVMYEAQISGAKTIADFHGLFSMFTTTLFGVFFLGMSKFQLGLAFGEYKDAD